MHETNRVDDHPVWVEPVVDATPPSKLILSCPNCGEGHERTRIWPSSRYLNQCFSHNGTLTIGHDILRGLDEDLRQIIADYARRIDGDDDNISRYYAHRYYARYRRVSSGCSISTDGDPLPSPPYLDLASCPASVLMGWRNPIVYLDEYGNRFEHKLMLELEYFEVFVRHRDNNRHWWDTQACDTCEFSGVMIVDREQAADFEVQMQLWQRTKDLKWVTRPLTLLLGAEAEKVRTRRRLIMACATVSAEYSISSSTHILSVLTGDPTRCATRLQVRSFYPTDRRLPMRTFCL